MTNSRVLPHPQIETVFYVLCDAGCVLLRTVELAVKLLSERWALAAVVATWREPVAEVVEVRGRFQRRPSISACRRANRAMIRCRQRALVAPIAEGDGDALLRRRESR